MPSCEFTISIISRTKFFSTTPRLWWTRTSWWPTLNRALLGDKEIPKNQKAKNKRIKQGKLVLYCTFRLINLYYMSMKHKEVYNCLKVKFVTKQCKCNINPSIGRCDHYHQSLLLNIIIITSIIIVSIITVINHHHHHFMSGPLCPIEYQ